MMSVCSALQYLGRSEGVAARMRYFNAQPLLHVCTRSCTRRRAAPWPCRSITHSGGCGWRSPHSTESSTRTAQRGDRACLCAVRSKAAASCTSLSHGSVRLAAVVTCSFACRWEQCLRAPQEGVFQAPGRNDLFGANCAVNGHESAVKAPATSQQVPFQREARAELQAGVPYCPSIRVPEPVCS